MLFIPFVCTFFSISKFNIAWLLNKKAARVEVNISLAFLYWLGIALLPCPWYSHIFVLKRDIKHRLTNSALQLLQSGILSLQLPECVPVSSAITSRPATCSLTTCLSPSLFASDSASADHRVHLQIIYTYLIAYLLTTFSPKEQHYIISGHILWGHSGPLGHALSLSLLLSSLSWTSMRRRRATVATAGKWQCKTARSGEWAQHCSNASCFNNSVKNSVKTCCSRYDVKWGHSGWSAVPCSYHLYMRCCIDPDGPWTLSAPGIRLNSGTSATVAVSAALVLCWFSVVSLSSCWYTYVYILVCVFFAGDITFLQLRFLKWRFVCSCCAVVVDIY